MDRRNRLLSTAINALKQHESQVDPEDAEKSMRRWRGETGQSNGVEYAEASSPSSSGSGYNRSSYGGTGGHRGGCSPAVSLTEVVRDCRSN